MAKLDVKLFGYYPEANCTTCQAFEHCGGEAHLNDDDGLKRSLITKYGDRIQVSLVNVFAPEVSKFPAVGETLKRNGLQVPIVMVDGEIKLVGSQSTKENIHALVDETLSQRKGMLSFLKH